MKTEDIYSFWSLLKEYEIKIPIIQRDYAQGRNTNDIKEIRYNFLIDIFESITNDKDLNLDFIYGSTKNNNAYDRKILLPLDGQQRLTTLFLVYWYVAWKDGIIHDNDEIREILSGFRYETRISSGEFCHDLVNQNSLKYNVNISNLSEAIKNESWFFASWIKDPTISSMLNMLDSIHGTFNVTNELSSKIFSKNNTIKFRFVELENFGLDDSLYIKMNARGKLLTHYENFKANLEKRLREFVRDEKLEEEIFNNIIAKFDTTWSDLFWSYRDTKTNVFDLQFLSLIQTLISYYAFTKEADPSIKLGAESPDGFVQKEYINYVNVEFILRFEKILDFFAESFHDAKHFLEPTTILDDNKLFIKVINNDMTYSDHLKFYGYCLYILKNNNISKDGFQNWMRVVSNMAENQTVNRLSDVKASIKSLHKLSQHSNYILSYLSEPGTDITGFSRVIIEEEVIKAQLILVSSEWKEAIIEAENHAYFRGQIIFLFRFSKIDKYSEIFPISNWTETELNEYLEKFKSYYNRLTEIFYPEKLLVDENLWRRALLTKGNYLLNQRRNLSFVTNTFDRDISWKRLLIHEDSKYVHQLIDELGFVYLEKELKKIIDDYIQAPNEDDWYYNFVKYEELISSKICGTNLFIRYEDDNSIYLLMTSKTSGRIREYNTTVLYLELKNKLYNNKIKISCDPIPGIRNPQYLKFSDNGRMIFIEHKNGWSYKYNEEDEETTIEIEDLLDLLEEEKYIEPRVKHINAES